MCEQFFLVLIQIFFFIRFGFFVAKRTKIGNRVKFILRLFYAMMGVNACLCVCLGEALSSSSRQQLHVCVSMCAFLNESKRSDEESVQ